MSFLGSEGLKQWKIERKRKAPRPQRNSGQQQRVRPTRAHVSGRHTGGRH